MHMFLVAQNLNKELLAKIESREKELSTRIEVRHHIQEEECQLIGHSKKFLDVIALARKVAPQDFPVLLEGNHGVGKKQLARKIHQWSGRKGACVLANCSAFTEAQMDRELFGKNGLFAQANGGTLIIDDHSNTLTTPNFLPAGGPPLVIPENHFLLRVSGFRVAGTIINYGTLKII